MLGLVFGKLHNIEHTSCFTCEIQGFYHCIYLGALITVDSSPRGIAIDECILESFYYAIWLSLK